MPRHKRDAATSGIYHVYTRGIDHHRLFSDEHDNLRFLQTLDTVPVDDFTVLAFCLMGNHVHLLVKVPRGEVGLKILQNAMKSIAARYAFHYNKRYQRSGALFQGRYASKVVEDSHYLLRVACYIHANPVKAGISSSMAAYPYSSYNDYFSHRKPLCRIDTSYIQTVSSLQKLLAYHNEEEYRLKDLITAETTSPTMLDDEACGIVCRIVGCAYAHDIERMPIPMRDAAIKMLRNAGISPHQLNRVTGVSRTEIKRLWR